MRTAFLYTDKYADYDYGPTHPLRLIRHGLTENLIRAYGLFDLPSTQVVEAKEATEEEIRTFHTEDYVDALRRANGGRSFSGAGKYGFGFGDNPIFKGVYDLSRVSAGASLQAARLVDSGEADVAFNIAGGLHHAMPDRASGFCYLNDPVLAIQHLLKRGKRVAYVDIDAHHGDGVQYAFYDTDRVLTISLHESGRFLFPGSGFEAETGEGAGEGYSVNVALSPYAGDTAFVWAFDAVVPRLIDAYGPDLLVTQLGVDGFRSDPITHLTLTTEGFCRMVERFRAFGLPWVALGGGGYDVSNVARGWTLAWALMNGAELPDELPEEYVERAERFGVEGKTLRDEMGPKETGGMEEARRSVEFLKDRVFPKVGA